MCDLPFASVDEIRAAYEFSDLQSFLDIYYPACAVLITEQDFYDLMYAYLERAHADGVRRAEIFFDPQTHTERGIPFGVFMDGFTRAIDDAGRETGISAALILCFLRHLPADAALETWQDAAAVPGSDPGSRARFIGSRLSPGALHCALYLGRGGRAAGRRARR